MTVIFSKKCELALQATLFLSTQQSDKTFSASEISERLGVPKEFVSKVLQTLTSNGIIGSKKGKTGGFYLARNPNEIRLIDIVEAIDGLDVFNKCVLGFPGCSVGEPCPVHDKWGTLREQAHQMLAAETLADLSEQTTNKINSL